MLSLHIPGCVLHVQHISARTRHVSRAQELSVAQATVLSSADTECSISAAQQKLVLFMSVSLSA